MRQSRVSVGSWRARLLLLAWPVGARRRWRRVVGDFAVLILEYRVAVAGIPVFEVTGFACLVHLVANLEQAVEVARLRDPHRCEDRKSTRLNSSHSQISYAVFCLKKKKNNRISQRNRTHIFR